MIGAIVGDIVGSVFEHAPIKHKSFPLFTGQSRFTDDTVLTVAIAEAILDGSDYAPLLCEYALRYPNAGYGGFFIDWAASGGGLPYNSWGNGSAMRVSPVSWAFTTADEVLKEAERSAAVTHNHPEGIKGAQATALALFLARQGQSRTEIRDAIERQFGYDLSRSVDEIRAAYAFDISCQGSVPESLISFLYSEDFEDAVRNAVSLGGDADTMACIAGAIAEAFYGGVPVELEREVVERLPPDLRAVVARFRQRYS